MDVCIIVKRGFFQPDLALFNPARLMFIGHFSQSKKFNSNLKLVQGKNTTTNKLDHESTALVIPNSCEFESKKDLFPFNKYQKSDVTENKVIKTCYKKLMVGTVTSNGNPKIHFLKYVHHNPQKPNR